ncbi:hypothetical protein H0H92_008565 [Tricholoma furcatifolium]|nr:hypothetical protein H0H92_008565 [Tricholoma furcatifolium]
MIDKLITQVVQNGAITAASALVNMILFVAQPDNLLDIRLYTNVLLANLNARRKHRVPVDHGGDAMLGLSSGGGVHISTFRHVHTEVELKPRPTIQEI